MGSGRGWCCRSYQVAHIEKFGVGRGGEGSTQVDPSLVPILFLFCFFGATKKEDGNPTLLPSPAPAPAPPPSPLASCETNQPDAKTGVIFSFSFLLSSSFVIQTACGPLSRRSLCPSLCESLFCARRQLSGGGGAGGGWEVEDLLKNMGTRPRCPVVNCLFFWFFLFFFFHPCFFFFGLVFFLSFQTAACAVCSQPAPLPPSSPFFPLLPLSSRESAAADQPPCLSLCAAALVRSTRSVA